VTALLEEFRARGPFASHITCAKAFEMIAGIKQQLTQLKEDEATLRRGLAIFKIDLPPSKDIAKVEAVGPSTFYAVQCCSVAFNSNRQKNSKILQQQKEIKADICGILTMDVCWKSIITFMCLSPSFRCGQRRYIF